MSRFSWAQRAVVLSAGLLVAVSVAIGLWPVSVHVLGDIPYSCGSGFRHSQQTWKVDSRALGSGVSANTSSIGYPSAACPHKVYSRRDLALLLGGLAIVGGAVGFAAVTTPEPPGANWAPRRKLSRLRSPRRRRAVVATSSSLLRTRPLRSAARSRRPHHRRGVGGYWPLRTAEPQVEIAEDPISVLEVKVDLLCVAVDHLTEIVTSQLATDETVSDRAS